MTAPGGGSLLPPVVVAVTMSVADVEAKAASVTAEIDTMGASATAAFDGAATAAERLGTSMSSLDAEFASMSGELGTVDASASGVAAAMREVSASAEVAAAQWNASLAEMSAEMDLLSANVEAQAAKAEASVVALGTSMEATASKGVIAGVSIAGVGKALAGVSIAAGVAAVGASDMAATFDQKMELIQTNAHDSTDNIQQMGQAVLAMAGEVGQSPDKLAEALYHVASTGITGSQALATLKASAEDATIGMADLDSVTYAMSGVMSIAMANTKFGVANAADGVAMLNDIVGQGDMRMQDLANAIGTGVLPAFSSAGLTMQDFGASLTVLTDNSMPAEVAATHLRTAVAMLQNQSAPAAAALESIGIKTGQLATDLRQPDGLLVAMEDLKTHLENSGKSAVEQGQIISKAFGGAKSASTIEALVGEIDKLQSKYAAMGTTASREAQMQQDWTNTQAQFKTQLSDAKAALEALAISVGQKLLPAVSGILHGFSGVATWLSHNKDAATVLAAVIGGALVVGLGLATAAVVSFTISLLANPITWIVIAIELLGLAIYELIKHWSAVSAAIKAVWHDITSVIGPLASWFNSNVIQPIVHYFQGWWKSVSQAIAPLVAGIKEAWDKISGFFQQHSAEIQKIIHTLISVIWDAQLKPFLQILAQGFELAWKQIVTIVETAFNIIRDVIRMISGVIQGFVSFIQGIVKLVSALLTGNWQGAWNAAGEIVRGSVQFITSIVGGIVHIGEDIVNGLIKGIENAAGALWNTVKSIASGITNAFKSVLSILSPSRVMADEVGKFIPAGIAQGITENAHLVTNAAKAVAAQATAAASLGGSIQLRSSFTGLESPALGVSPGVISGGAVGAGVAGAGSVQQIVITMNPRDVREWLQTGTLRYDLRNNGNGLSTGVR